MKYFIYSPFAGYDFYRLDKEETYKSGVKHCEITRLAAYRIDSITADGQFYLCGDKEDWDEEQMTNNAEEIDLHTVIKDLFTAKSVR